MDKIGAAAYTYIVLSLREYHLFAVSEAMAYKRDGVFLGLNRCRGKGRPSRGRLEVNAVHGAEGLGVERL